MRTLMYSCSLVYRVSPTEHSGEVDRVRAAVHGVSGGQRSDGWER